MAGLDLVELGDSVLRAQRNPRSVNRHQLQSSQGSILEMDAETPSKDSLGSIGCFPPPTYESIYGKEETDMPPSYSDILLHRYIIFISTRELLIILNSIQSADSPIYRMKLICMVSVATAKKRSRCRV